MKNNCVKSMMLLLITCIVLSGCWEAQKRLTKEEWDIQYKPATMEEAKAKGQLEHDLLIAKAEAESMNKMNNLKWWCGIGFVCSIFAIALPYKLSRLLGGAGAIACITGFGLAYAGNSYDWVISIIGLVIGCVAGTYAIFIMIMGFKQIVLGNKKFLGIHTTPFAEISTVKDFKDSQRSVQWNSTKALVKSVIKKAEKKGTDYIAKL